MSIIAAIDWDEPVFPWYDYAHDTALQYGLADEEMEPPTKWDPTTVYGCELQAWYDAIDKEILKGPSGMYGRPIKPGVRAQLLRLKRRGIPIHVVTARGQFGPLGDQIKELTLHQIAQERLPITQVHFAKQKLPVLLKLREKGEVYFLDDRANYIEEAYSYGFGHAYLLDERWNQDAVVGSARRVYSTRQYVDIVCAHHDERVLMGIA